MMQLGGLIKNTCWSQNTSLLRLSTNSRIRLWKLLSDQLDPPHYGIVTAFPAKAISAWVANYETVKL